jgi:hypothetical protein
MTEPCAEGARRAGQQYSERSELLRGSTREAEARK